MKKLLTLLLLSWAWWAAPTRLLACDAVYATVPTLGPTAASILFAGVSGAASYTLRYYVVGDSTQGQTLTVAPGQTNLLNLQPGTEYRFRIITNCVGGGTATTPTSYFRTTGTSPCGMATNVVLTAISATTATVSFTPGANNTGYVLVYYAPHAADSTRHTVSTTASPVTLTGLVAGQTYYVRVTSTCYGSPVTGSTTGSLYVFTFRGTSPLVATGPHASSSVQAYPNPARQLVTVQVPAALGANSARLVLLDALGQPVRTHDALLPASGAPIEVSLAGVAAGLYVLRVAAGGTITTLRLAVE